MPFIAENPPEWNTLLANQAKPRTGLHVTDCLGCPRRRAGLAEGWPVDLAKLESRLMGTILHGALATISPETAEIAVAGTLFGHQIVGSVDRMGTDDDGFPFTCDYKTSEGGAPLPDAPYQDQVWQQEAYRRLLWLDDKPTAGWWIYYRRGGKWSKFEHIGAVWNEKALGEFRPHEGAFTTRELAGQCASNTPAASLPLVGATQKMGKGTSCEYCEVQAACDAAGMEIEL